MEVAQQIAGWFLEKGDIVVWQESKIKGERIKINLKAQGPAIFTKYQIVVLINHGSASASEILAGALRDNRNILLVGEKSFGKGSVQEQLTLSDGSSLKVTTSQWLTPNENLINEVGLTPDFLVEIPEVEEDGDLNDLQLIKAIELLE